MHDRSGLALWLHRYTRWWVDVTRLVLQIDPDSKADDTVPFFRYDNKDGLIAVKKDWGYVIGHIVQFIPLTIIIGVIYAGLAY